MRNRLLIKFMLIALVLACAPASWAKIRFGTAPNYTEVTNSEQHYLKYVRYMTVPENLQTGAVWTAGDDEMDETNPDNDVIADIQALEDPLRRTIFDKMKATTTEMFGFRDIAHAKARVTQRVKTAEKMQAFNIDNNYRYLGVDYGDEAPVKIPTTSASHWTNVRAGSFLYKQKGGTDSGTAHNDINQLCASSTRTYGECYGAIVACVWWGAAQGMGATAFNTLHPTTEPLNMNVSFAGIKHINFAKSGSENIHVPGDWVYFKNFNYGQVVHGTIGAELKDEKLLSKTHIYLLQGENAICTDDDSYEGLGMGPYSKNAMKIALANSYNTELAAVIAKASLSGGMYKGLEIKNITSTDLEDKVTVIGVKRVTHLPQ